MEAPGIRLALWLLLFTMLLPMLSGDMMFPAGVKKQLCESGKLGGKQKWKCDQKENGDGEGNPGDVDGMADDSSQPSFSIKPHGRGLLIILSSQCRLKNEEKRKVEST